MYPDGTINDQSSFMPSITGYALGHTSDMNWLIVGSTEDIVTGGSNMGGFTFIGVGKIPLVQ